MWKRLRAMLRAIQRGLPPARAAALHNIASETLATPRVAALVRVAEARMQRDALSAVWAATTPGMRKEYGWGEERSSDDSHTPTRARAWQKSADWKPAAFLLERRYPSEWGNQQPQQVTETVVQVLTALAALRQQPASLESLRHRPQLAAGEAGPTVEG